MSSSSSPSVASVSAATVSIAANAPSGLPWLHSLPGAPVAIFLDFDGYGSSAPYDTDGQPTTFNASEQRDITEAWRHVASYFSMFYADVTTQPPSVPYSYSLISNSQTGVGYSYSQFPTTTPSAYNGSGDARTRQSGLAHEIGHNFGLAHQGEFDLLGGKTAEYFNGYDKLHGPIMGVDYAQDVHKWFLGHPSHSPSLLQDDVATIADKINNYSGGDGFRPDDVPNAIGSARALIADAGGAYAASGIIERMTDADAYAFTSLGGQVRFDVATPQPSMLDAKLEVYAADGTLVATADASTNDQHLTIPALPAGTFYAVVKSHGNYADLGPYDLTVRALPDGFLSKDVGAVGQKGYAAFDPASTSYTVGGGGADIGTSADEFHFAYTQLLGDGSITARVVSQENTAARAAAGVMVRESLAAGSRQATMALTPSGGAQFRYRSTTDGTTAQVTTPGASAPHWVRLVRSGPTVTAFRSPDGVAWEQQGTMTFPTGAASVYVGLAVSAANDASVSDARFDNVSLEGNVGLVGAIYAAIPAPTGLTLSRGAATGVDLSWQAVDGATGYSVERSLDGVSWSTAGSTGADVFTYSDPSLAGSLRYFYRVSAFDGAGRSAPSVSATIVNRPGAPTSLAVTSWQTDKLILNWRDTVGESGYRIERAPDASDAWSVRGAVGPNVPSFTDTGLATDTRYRYRVVATSAFGDGGAADTTGSTRLPAVTGVAFTEKLSNKLSLKWNAVSGATAYRILRSTNGADFTTLSTVAAASTAYGDEAVSPVKEYYYRVVALSSRAESMDGPDDDAFAATPAAAALPAGWQSRDVGAVGGSGASGYSGSGPAATFTVIASGGDIWNAADAFRFTYQPLAGDGSIIARVASQEDTGGWAKAGVMIRESLAANSRQAMMMVTPGNGTSLQYRTATAGQSATGSTFPGPKAPYWVRLQRRGNTIIGSRSADGVTWTVQGSINIAMTRNAYVGLAVTAADNSTLDTVTFTDVSISNAAPTVASPASASPATVTDVSTALSVLGADDHGEANLSYSWSAIALPEGAAAPTFSDNGTNEAKSVTATFSRAGTYVLRVRISDSGGLSALSEVTVVVEPTLARLRIAPAEPVTVAPGGTIHFSATAVDQFGQPMPAPAPPAWSTSGGSIADDGAFIAPAQSGRYTVTALAGTVGGSVEVTVAVPDATAPRLRSVSSHKTHGPRGDFGLPLSLGADAASATVEPRLGGPTVLIFTFDEPVVAEDGLLDATEFYVSNAAFGSATLDPSGEALTLVLTGINDRSVITVTVGGLADLSGNPLAGDSDVSVRALAGDVNGNGVVDQLDFLFVRRALLRPLTDQTFLADINLDGAVDTIDLLYVRRSDGHVVP